MSKLSLEVLKDPSSPEFQVQWSSFLFNVQAAREFLTISKEEAAVVLTAAASANGTGWTSTSASKVIYQVTGVPMVSGSWEL